MHIFHALLSPARNFRDKTIFYLVRVASNFLVSQSKFFRYIIWPSNSNIQAIYFYSSPARCFPVFPKAHNPTMGRKRRGHVLVANHGGRQEKFLKSRRFRMAKTVTFWPWWQPFNDFCFETLPFVPLFPFFLFAAEKSGGGIAGPAQFFATERALKMMKNDLFHLKSSFCSREIYLFFLNFWIM